ncbi:MAG TPA: inositol monophosphatase family protein [Trueperaceae bacterium]|nr:inositol monophosphatase family protein [Trueperaceae bacterium]
MPEAAATRAPLPDLQFDDYLATATMAAREAAAIQLAERGSDLQVSTKSSAVDLVTRVDRLCEERIRRVILASHPGHTVLGEEAGTGETSDGRSDGASGDGRPEGRRGVSYRWIVDPLDGTVNYAHGFPFYCVSIALEVDGVVEVGVVYDGERDEMFTAKRGRGATLNGEPIAVSDTAVLRSALLATGFAYVTDTISLNLEVFARVLPQVQSVRRPGAAALDICYVACGRVDGFWELALNSWDVAAGVLIVREAGGTVTGAASAPYRLDDPVLVASNGALHAKLLDLLRLDELRA